MDNFLLHAIVVELEAVLIGRSLGRVYQHGATEIMIDFRMRDGRWLAVSTDPQSLALYLTHSTPKQLHDEPRSDTAFVSLIKKHLGGVRLTSIEKIGYDRVVKFGFSAEDDQGRPRPVSLVVSLTGRSANILLLDGIHIIASLKNREEPVEQYKDPAPPADKIDPFLCSAEKLEQLISDGKGDVAAAAKNLIGFTGIYADELAFRAKNQAPHVALRGLLNDLFESPPMPVIYSSPSINQPGLLNQSSRQNNQNTIISPVRFKHLPQENARDFAGVNDAADIYFSTLNARRKFLALKLSLGSSLASRLKKLKTLAANLTRESETFSKAAMHQKYGELLLANLSGIVETGKGFIVTDFYDESQPKVEIPSADKANAKDAAEHYFKLARKARHGQEKISARLPEVHKEISSLESLRQKLSAIDTDEDLNSIAREIEPGMHRRDRAGKPATQQPKKKREEKLTGVRKYRSSDGYEILVGRTDRDNDNLTFRIAKSFDLWFHAADYPGSHVVLRNPQRQGIPHRSITEAAQLAAKFSQAKGGAKVAVNYCERKFVTKMKGFAPGQVRLSSFKTAMVEPGEAGERVL